MGRPSKLTPEVQAKVVEALEKGQYRDVAAKYAGVDERTFYRWMERGAGTAKGDDAFRQFRQAVEKAETETAVRATGLVLAAAHDNWQAAGWWLERKFPEKFARRDYIQLVSQSVQQALEAVRAAMTEVADKRGDKTLMLEFANALKRHLGTLGE